MKIDIQQPLEMHWKRDQRATLTVLAGTEGPGEEQIASLLNLAGVTIASCSVSKNAVQECELSCDVH